MREPVSDSRLQEVLEALDGWRHDGDRIERVYEFPAYGDAAAFAQRIFLLAERQRRPLEAVCVMPGRVGVALATPEVGVTEEDLRMAALINHYYEQFDA